MRKWNVAIAGRIGFVSATSLATIALGALAALIVGDGSPAAWNVRGDAPLYDPSYAYAFNSISPANGIAPIFFGHPGLPVIYLGALFAPLAQLLPEAGGQSLNQLAIQNTELLIDTIQYSLLFINLILLITAVTVYRSAQGKIGPAIILQAMWLLFIPEYFRVMYMNGESLAIGAGTLALALVASQGNPPLVAKEANGSSDNFLNRIAPWLVGTLVAIATLSKITFLPLALILFSFGKASQIRQSFLALAITALILIVPILGKLPMLFDWLFVLATHRGIYGTGDPGFVDWSKIPDNALDLLHSFPIAGLIMALSTLMLLVVATINFKATRSVREVLNNLRTPIIIYAALAIQLMMVMKHYRPHYAIPAVLLSACCFIVLSGHLERAGRSARLIGSLAWAAVFCAGALWLTRAIPEAIAAASSERSSVGSLREQFEREIGQFDKPLLITTYGSRGEAAAISFGLSYAGLDLGKLLNPGDRASLYYSASNGMFRDASAGWLKRERIDEKIRSGVPVLYFGPPGSRPPGFAAKLLMRDDALDQELLLLQPPALTMAPSIGASSQGFQAPEMPSGKAN